MSKSKLNLPHDETLIRSIAGRVVERCDFLETVSDADSGLTRVFCSPAMKVAHTHFQKWMSESQMESRLDAAGNLIGCYKSRLSGAESSTDQRPVFLIGSHLDSVINAGRFDGALGALLGLGVAELIHEAGVELRFDLDIVGFSEEEGVRYKFPFIGSLGLVGELTSEDLDRQDQDSTAMRQALREFGCDVDAIESASYRNQKVVGFMEAHIEQADLLQDESLAVGVVTSIAGQTRANIQFVGKAGHAGTVLHDRRQDALAAAAELILKIESIGQRTDGLYATVGCIDARPGLSNVISGQTELRLDLRHESDAARSKAFNEIETMIDDVSQSRNVVGKILSADHTPATKMDVELTEHFRSSVRDAGQDVKNMVSGAGHDAMIMARMAPSCMLFVRCKDGISHHPDEFVSPEDIYFALKVMADSLVRISNSMPD